MESSNRRANTARRVSTREYTYLSNRREASLSPHRGLADTRRPENLGNMTPRDPSALRGLGGLAGRGRGHEDFIEPLQPRRQTRCRDPCLRRTQGLRCRDGRYAFWRVSKSAMGSATVHHERRVRCEAPSPRMLGTCSVISSFREDGNLVVQSICHYASWVGAWNAFITEFNPLMDSPSWSARSSDESRPLYAFAA